MIMAKQHQGMLLDSQARIRLEELLKNKPLLLEECDESWLTDLDRRMISNLASEQLWEKAHENLKFSLKWKPDPSSVMKPSTIIKIQLDQL